MEVKDIDIKAVKPYKNNAKEHPQKQIDQIAESIERFGWAQPLVIDENNNIIIGHGRYEAAKQLRLKTVPCVLITDLTDEEVRMLRLMDNKLNESDWDYEKLAIEIEGLDFSDFDIDWGLDIDAEPEPTDLEEDIDTSGGVVVTIRVPDVNVWDSAEDELKEIVDRLGGTMAVKME